MITEETLKKNTAALAAKKAKRKGFKKPTAVTAEKKKIKIRTRGAQLTSYTSEINSKWLDALTKRAKISKSATVNRLLTNVRKTYKGSKLNELIQD